MMFLALFVNFKLSLKIRFDNSCINLRPKGCCKLACSYISALKTDHNNCRSIEVDNEEKSSGSAIE